MPDNNIVLVAPRPLRVSPLAASQRPLFSAARLVSAPADVFSLIKTPDSDEQPHDVPTPPSVRNSASPRLNLSPDVLEEFFSILQPSLFAPNSPTFRLRRRGSGSTLSFPFERPYPYRNRSRNENGSVVSMSLEDVEGKDLTDESGYLADVRSCNDIDYSGVGLCRIPGLLESPVSRMHTRNPFQRHPSYEVAFTNTNESASQLSPALLPLPASPPPTPPSLSLADVSFNDSEETKA